MAISFVGSATAVDANVATFDITLPTCQENDIVIVLIGNTTNSSDTAYPVVTSGYTEVADLFSSDTRWINCTVSWKRMGATPDTSVTCTGRTGLSYYGVFGVAYVFRGVDETTALDVTTTTDTGTDSGHADAPSITPTTSGSVVVACGFSTKDNPVSVTGPSGYSDHVYANSTESFGGVAAAAWKAWSGSGAEDPGAWEILVDGVAEAWAAATLALREQETTDLILNFPMPTPLFGSGPALDVDIPLFEPDFLSGFSLDIDLPAPEVLLNTGAYTVFGITMPVPTVSFSAQGFTAALDVTLPEFEFLGAMSSPADLVVEVDMPTFEFASGSSLEAEMSVPEIAFTAVTGFSSYLEVDFLTPVVEAYVGSGLSLPLPVPEVEFSATVGSSSRLVVGLPTPEVQFTALVDTSCQLLANTVVPQVQFGLTQEILSSLYVLTPAPDVLFSTISGGMVTLNIDLPAFESLLSLYEISESDLVMELPALRPLFDMSDGARFDSEILQWRRPGSCN